MHLSKQAFLHIFTQGPAVGDATIEKTSPLPGLALGCQAQPRESFTGWEKREQGGALKSMFFWKGLSVSGPPPPQKQPRRKNEEQGNSSKILTTKPPSLDTGCSENIDRTVYKVLTKKTGKRSGKKQKTTGKTDGWRGPREQSSEAPAQRKESTKKNQVKYQML